MNSGFSVGWFFTRLFRCRLPLSVFGALALAVSLHATIGVSLQLQLGNPSGAVSDPNNHDHYLQPHDQYVFDFSDHNGEPNWVSWDLTTADLGGSGRANNFLPDPDLPNTFYHVVTTDYTGSGYDRGHMCPSADRTITPEDNQVTFYLGQILPQSPDNNQGIWANFEAYCRSQASAGNEVLLTSGPSGFSGSRIPSGVAAIPGYTWKVAVIVPVGPGSAVSRITASTRVIAIKVPNIAGVRTTPWENFVTSVAQIESDTGFTFFTNLPSSVANALRTVVDGQSAAGSPSITAQPANQTTGLGGTATFSVTATGDDPLTYQWLKNDDVVIDGATSSTLTLSNVQAADLGNYYVVVTNAVGSATSNLAQLVILGLPPTISTSPTSTSANAGSNLTLSVTASGSPTLVYQWRKDGSPISGATSSALNLGNVQASDAGSYDVVVTNSVSSATSAAATVTVNPAAPTIIGQPISKTASTGGNASFTITAVGSAPLTYQWRKNGATLSDGGVVSGATTSTLLLSGVSAADSANYDVVVTNALNSVASSVVTLTVNPPPPSTVNWDFTTANPTSGLTADITGGTLTQGNNNGTTPLLTTTSASSGYTGSSGGNNAGAAARTGALNQAASGSAYFEFTLAPSAGERLLTTGISFGMRSTSTGPQAFGVYTSFDNFAAAVATSTVPNDGNWHLYTPTFSTVTRATGTPITFRIYGYGGTGTAAASTANWRMDDLKLTINAVFPPPVPAVVTSTSPTNGATSVAISSPITIGFNEAVSFTGTWFSINSAANGPISASVTGGPTTFTLSPPSFFANNDTITVTIFGAQVVDQATGTIHGASNTTFSFSTETYVPPTPPVVTTQPSSQTLNAGTNATFTVAASGTAPFTYQWRKNGTAISGNSSASTATLQLTALTLGDSGNYDCLVSNAAGSDLSQSATLTVQLVAPSIATPPVAQTALLGGSASFTVTAGGTAPFTYQWRKNGVALTNSATVIGADTATLTLSALSVDASGSYDVIVTNPASSATSSAAVLAVTSAPANTIIWDFTTADPTSGLPSGVTGGTLSQGNNNGTTTLITAVSASSGYTGSSGGNNAGAAARTGALNKGAAGSAYFEFTLAPSAGQQLAVISISFGMRSTGTGPQGFAIFSNADNYASPLATSIVPADGAWHSYSPASSGVTSAAGTALTFRIFGYNGVGSPASGTANWRVDDLKVTAGVLATSLPPVITTQPANLTATVGDNVSFSVTATGSSPLTYSWRKDSVAITGNATAATATLTLTNVTTADAGSYDVIVSNPAGATPSNAASLAVNKAVATVTFGTTEFGYDGFVHAASVTTAPAGLNVLVTYNGNNAAPADAGSYALVATIDDPNYTGSATGTLVIDKAAASVLLSQLGQTYDGSPKPVSVTTSPGGLGVAVTYNGSATAPTAVGSYTVAASVSNPNYSGTATGTLTIAPSNATITLGNLTQFYDGTPKSVTATSAPAGLNILVTYNGIASPPTLPGNYAVIATIADPNYTGSAAGNLVIRTTALVRHAPTINGGIDGSLQMLFGEAVSFNSASYLSGDFLVPGTPNIVLNGGPNYGGTQDGSGNVDPANYTVTINSGAVLRHIIRRIDPAFLPVMDPPPSPTGTRSVAIGAKQSPGDFSTLRNLTLNSGAGQIAVPGGTYGNFVANSNTGFTLGVAGATVPAVYNFQALTLNSGTQLQVVGPVIVTILNPVTINSGVVGASDHPEWLTLNIVTGGLTLNSAVHFNGNINSPTGIVTLNGTTTVKGSISADRLTIERNALLDQP